MILFAHSNFLVDDPKQCERMKPYAPLSTLIAAALVRRAGHEVQLFDATFAAGVESFATQIADLRPGAVVLMEDNFNFLTKMCTATRRERALAMVHIAHGAGARVCVNGPDAADHPRLYLDAGADAVVLGEGEAAVLELVEHWSAVDTPPATVAGLVLPTADGPIRTSRRGSVEDPSALPLPAWDLVDVGAYRSAWRAAHGRFSWNAVASRGCPYGCNWCAKPSFGRRYTIRSPESMVAELKALKVAVNPDHLWLADDIFGLEARWLDRFAALAVAEGAVIPFSMQSRVNLMTARTVAALASAGAEEVWLGIESGSQKILDAMNKGTRVEAARSATRLLKGHGIRACWFIQLGYPGEDWDDILATRDLIRDEQPDEIGVSVSYPLPGTEFYERVRSQLKRRRNWRDTGELAMLFQGTFDTGFYRHVRNLLHREVDQGHCQDHAWQLLQAESAGRRSAAPSLLAARH